MKLVVVGTGKMGSWIANALRQEHELQVYDSDSSKAAQLGLPILARLADLPQAAPEMLINAVELQNTVEVFHKTVPLLPSTCMLCDVTSIKKEVARYYETAGRRYVSIHPMFGPTFANMEALREENAIIIRESDREGAALFLRLFGQLGVKLFEFSFEEHDRLMAYSLATPFVASLVFAACLDTTTVPGSTFARHTRIARGLLAEDDRLLSEILFNTDSLAQIEKITARLEFLKHIILGKDHDEMRGFLEKLRKNLR